VMQISQIVGGFSMSEADELRKAMGKKKKEIISRMRNQFLEGARARGIDGRKAEELYDLMAEFAEYGFNKSHSAAYAVISYQTAWLKANYPLEYMAALLTSQKTDTDKLEIYIREAQAMGIPILPPDVNKSAVNFAVENTSIRYGLSAIKGIGEIASETIVRARGEKTFFRDLTEFCSAVDQRTVNKRVMEALVNSGAFASTGKPRSALFAGIDAAITQGNRIQADTASGQGTLFESFSESPAEERETGASNNNGEIPPEEWPEDTLLSLEKELLGAYITGHPLARYRLTWKKLGLLPSRKHAGAQIGSALRIGGILRQVQEKLTKGGQAFGIITLEDMDGNYDILLFSSIYKKFQPLLTVGTALLVNVVVTLQKGRDKANLNVQNIQPLDDFVVHDLHITLRPETTGEELHEMREFLLDEKQQGNSAVYLHLEEEARSVMVCADSVFRVNPSEELVSRLSAFRCVEEVTLE